MLALGIIAGLLLILVGLWVAVPILSGLPWRPTSAGRIRQALQLVNLQPGELFYDLGAGDGRVLLAAAGFGARVVGVEISPVHCLVIWLAARMRGLGSQITVRCADFNRTTLADADVVFAYMTAGPAERLRPRLEAQLRPGSRVVTVSFSFKGWKPVAYDPETLVFVYHMPPEPGGLEAYLQERW